MSDSEIYSELAEAFARVVDLPAPERSAYLLRFGVDRPQLRRALERLLATDHAIETGDAEDPLIGPIAAGRAADTPPHIDGFRLLRRLGSGSAGTVYEAQQHRPRRRVAIKVLHDRHAADADAFSHEADVLAQVVHPGVAQVFAADVTADGHAFLVMELVEGRSITEHCAGENMSVADRVRLIVQVCDAIAQAHRLGVVHRDLKPANVLVDAAGRTKIVDFGVAAITTPPQPTDRTSGGLAGTLAYMSPEQLAATPTTAVVDARADVYALGVLMYELLAGRLPVDLRGVPFGEAAHYIATTPPMPLGSVDRTLRGDLDAICAKAIRHEPSQRYADATALADDLRRHLSHLPVRARRNPPLLRSVKFVRRHRLALRWGLSVSVVCGVMLLALQWSARREAFAQRSRADAEQNVQRHVARLRLYETRLQLAADAWRAHQLGRAGELLVQAAERQSDEADLRGWEWDYLWNVTHPPFLSFGGRLEETHAVRVSPDGRRLATCGSDSAVHIFDLTDNDPAPRPPLLTLNGHTTCVFSVDWSPDGRRLFSTDYGGNSWAWDAVTGQSLTMPMPASAETGDCTGAALSPDGRYYAVAIQERGVSVYDLNAATIAWQSPRPPKDTAWVSMPAWSRNGERLAVGLNDGSTLVWSFEPVPSGGLRESRPPLRLRESAQLVQTVVFDGDGRSLVCGYADGSIVCWDLTTRQPRYKIRAHDDWVMGVAFNSDGTQFATAGRDAIVRCWESASGKLLRTYAGHTGWVFGVTFDAAGRVISGGSDSQLRRWENLPDEGPAVSRTPAASAPVTSKPDSVGSPDGSRSVHTTDTGELSLHEHGVPRWSANAAPGRPAVIFTPDAARLISGSGDGVVRVWDAVTGRLLLRLDDAASAAISELAWQDDGRTLVARTDAGETLRWKAARRAQ